jgi:hypothetical protein
MRNERVVLHEGETERTVKQAHNLVIPDVRPLALCLSGIECDTILWSHCTAAEALEKIVRRQRWNYIKEVFEIDVPDLDTFAVQFPKEEKALLLDFWTIYAALVHHFIPKATQRAYYFDGGKRAGVRHHGMAWYTPENK